MFEEIAVALKVGVFDDSIRIGHHVNERFQQGLEYQTAMAEYQNIITNVNKYRNEFFDIKRKLEDRVKELESSYCVEIDSLKIQAKDYRFKISNLNESLTKSLNDNKMLIEDNKLSIEAEREKNNKAIYNLNKEFRSNKIADIREINNLREEKFYSDAEIISDNAVNNFLRLAVKKGEKISDLEQHEINIFALSYETYIKENGKYENDEWRNRLADAIDSRYS